MSQFSMEKPSVSYETKELRLETTENLQGYKLSYDKVGFNYTFPKTKLDNIFSLMDKSDKEARQSLLGEFSKSDLENLIKKDHESFEKMYSFLKEVKGNI